MEPSRLLVWRNEENKMKNERNSEIYTAGRALRIEMKKKGKEKKRCGSTGGKRIWLKRPELISKHGDHTLAPPVHDNPRHILGVGGDPALAPTHPHTWHTHTPTQESSLPSCQESTSPSRNRTSKSSVQGSHAGRIWVRSPGKVMIKYGHCTSRTPDARLVLVWLIFFHRGAETWACHPNQ